MKRFAVVFLLLSIVSSGPAQDTIDVYAGWNNIGALGSGVTPAQLVTVPPGIIITSMYAYNPGAGYASSDTLKRGRGYWVKVSGDGLIIFGNPDTCDVSQVTYDGTTYTAVKIGDQCWLRENLNAGVMIDSLQGAANNGTIEKYCYGNDTANCTTYGGLYRWTEMMQYGGIPGSQGICPPGWHIPTKAEYQTLSTNVGGDGNALKAVGQGSGGGAGTNTSGFSALLAGIRYDFDGHFADIGANGSFWTSTLTLGAAEYVELLNNPGLSIWNTFENQGYSVRCIQD